MSTYTPDRWVVLEFDYEGERSRRFSLAGLVHILGVLLGSYLLVYNRSSW